MIVLFTRQYGKISAGTSINEKSRSKAALALRPFTYAEYDIFKGRETYSINSASAQKSLYSIGEDLDRFMAASSFIEYLDKVLGEEEPMPKLFDLSLQFLESVSKSGKNAETLLYAFIFKSLSLLGVAPEMSCCVNCGKQIEDFWIEAKDDRADSEGIAGRDDRADSKGVAGRDGRTGKESNAGKKRIAAFSVSGGGLICPDCEASEKTAGDSLIYRPSFDIIGVFRYFGSKPLKTFEKAGLRPEAAAGTREILSEYISRYLGTDVLRQQTVQEV